MYKRQTDDPVRMYLREMGAVELLSREGEIAIAKRIEAGRDAMIREMCIRDRMVTLGNGATQAVQMQIAGLGTNLLLIRPGQRHGRCGGGGSVPQFTEADANALKAQIGGVAASAPEGRASLTLVPNGRN